MNEIGEETEIDRRHTHYTTERRRQNKAGDRHIDRHTDGQKETNILDLSFSEKHRQSQSKVISHRKNNNDILEPS